MKNTAPSRKIEHRLTPANLELTCADKAIAQPLIAKDPTLYWEDCGTLYLPFLSLLAHCERDRACAGKYISSKHTF